MIISDVPAPGDPDRRPHIAHLAVDTDPNDPDAVMLRNYVRLAVSLGLARPLIIDSDRSVLISTHLWSISDRPAPEGPD